MTCAHGSRKRAVGSTKLSVEYEPRSRSFCARKEMPMRSLPSIRGLGLAGLCLPVMLAGCGKQPDDADSASTAAAPPPTSRSAEVAASPAVQGVSLENTHWRLVQVAGQPPAITPADRAEPYFILMSDGRQMQGFSGCNRMGGPYETDGRGLKFGAVRSTKMAC